MRLRVLPGILLLVGAVLNACAGATPTSTDRAASNTSPAPAAPKRVVAAVVSDFSILSSQITRGGVGSRSGVPELEQLVHGGLTIADDRGVLRPQFAEAVPSAENGLWKVHPDGRMETTWVLRPSVLWQDGTPLTADDLLFTARVGQDRELPHFKYGVLDLVEGVEAPDARTLLVRWKTPFIEADALFGATGSIQALPLPRLLLEKAYLESRATFVDLPYWSDGFVGAGPYALREWLKGSYLVLDANPRYVLGRPRIDVIEVKFIADPNTIMANILSNAIELPLGADRSVSFEQGL